jgi:hypothetical protein
MAKSKGEEEFIEQKTRELLVVWADYCLKGGSLPDFESITEEDLQSWVFSESKGLHPVLQEAKNLGIHKEYWDLALSRGWLTKKTPRTLTSAGWGVAAAFLKR